MTGSGRGRLHRTVPRRANRHSRGRVLHAFPGRKPGRHGGKPNHERHPGTLQRHETRVHQNLSQKDVAGRHEPIRQLQFGRRKQGNYVGFGQF